MPILHDNNADRQNEKQPVRWDSPDIGIDSSTNTKAALLSRLPDNNNAGRMRVRQAAQGRDYYIKPPFSSRRFAGKSLFRQVDMRH